MKTGLKYATEIGPLFVFLISNYLAGIYWATGLFMAATALAIFLSWRICGHISKMLLISGGFVITFGALTLFLHDEAFIKIKVTFYYIVVGCLLLGGLAAGRTYLKLVLGEAVKLSDEAWRVLTWRFGLFMFFLAGLNEIVRHMVSTDQWIMFKFLMIFLTMGFFFANMPYIAKHLQQEES